MKSLLFLLLFTALNAHAAKIISIDGQETQNGGGAAEQTFAYALTKLKVVYRMCLAVDDCVRVKEQREILAKIHASIDQELANPGLIRFKASWWPDFMRDGQMRVAVTGSKVGDTIYLNRDMIYTRRGEALVPYTMGEAISLLTHELGHHQGEKDHDLLDQLGANVRAFFESESETIVMDPFTNRYPGFDIRLNAFHTRQPAFPYAHESIFLLSVGEAFFDLNPDIWPQMSCSAIAPMPAQVAGFRFFQMHWSDQVTVEGDRVRYLLEAKVWVECIARYNDGHISHMAIPHRARLFLDFMPFENGSLVYVDHSLRLELAPEKQ